MRAEAISEAEHAALDELDVESRSLAALLRTAGAELRVARDEKTLSFRKAGRSWTVIPAAAPPEPVINLSRVEYSAPGACATP